MGIIFFSIPEGQCPGQGMGMLVGKGWCDFDGGDRKVLWSLSEPLYTSPVSHKTMVRVECSGIYFTLHPRNSYPHARSLGKPTLPPGRESPAWVTQVGIQTAGCFKFFLCFFRQEIWRSYYSIILWYIILWWPLPGCSCLNSNMLAVFPLDMALAYFQTPAFNTKYGSVCKDELWLLFKSGAMNPAGCYFLKRWFGCLWDVGR